METILAIIAALVVSKLTFKFFFDDMEDFLECVKFWPTPDIISMFKGQFEHDWWAELKLFCWLLLVTLVGYGSYQFLT